MNIALIFAGGVGSRVKSSNGQPKQFIKIFEKEILIHTLEVFNNCKCIDQVLVVCKIEYISLCRNLVKDYSITKVIDIIPGGDTGMLSIRNGIYYLKEHSNLDNNSLVLVHDGVRPIIDEETISNCIEVASTKGNCVTVCPCTETVALIDKDSILQIEDRNHCFNIKAPQCFKLGEIYELHKESEKSNVNNIIDSATLFKLYDKELYFTLCSDNNIKVTTDKDIDTCRFLLSARI